MIEDVTLVGQGNVGCEKVAERADDAVKRKVSARVIILPDHEDARMMAACGDDENVKFAEVAVILGENQAVFTDGMRQVIGVFLAGHPCIARELHLMFRSAEQLH